jgi:long-chain acyl-CoA synthetase
MQHFFDGDVCMSTEPHLWEQSYPRGLKWSDPIRQAPLHVILDNTISKFPNRPAFNFMGKKWTWDEVGTLVNRMAKGLHDLGVERGSKVGICLPNTPYFLIAYYAITKTGATVVNFNPLYSEKELSHQIEDSQTDMMITTDLHVVYDKMGKMLNDTRLNQLVICPFKDILPFPKNILFPLLKSKDIATIPNDDRHVAFSKIIDNDGAFQAPHITPSDDIAVLQYTGGTTGVPKGAMLTHANITGNVEQVAHWLSQHAHAGQEKIVGVIPFFHVFAMTAVMNLAVRYGFEIVALPKFELEATLKLIHKEKPHYLMAVPAIFNAINNSPILSRYDLTSLRYCVSGGAPLPVEVRKKFEERTGCVVIEGYGLTEASPVVCVNPPDGLNKAGSIGLPLAQTTVELRDPETQLLVPLGERGELCVRGPQVMKGYWGKPDETAKVIHDGFLRTGDVAVMDKDGFVFIVDRIKDLILVNGYNVYPRNIEEAIYTHPCVEECIVAGIPDEQRGEVPKAWIKLKDGRQLSDTELKEFLKDKLSPIEMPRYVEFRDKPLPKTMIGKLSRKDVLAEDRSKSSI